MELVHSLSTTSPNVMFPLEGSNGRTLTFNAGFDFKPEQSYYVFMDNGEEIAIKTLAIKMHFMHLAF